MPDQIETLQREIADHTIPVTALLQKALVLANRLGEQEFSAWAKGELNGYAEEDEQATYRSLKGAYIVLTADGRRLPIHWERSPLWTNSRFITLPLPELESLTSPAGGSCAVKVRVDPQALASLNIEPGDTVAFEMGQATIVGFLHAVRNKILDWTFELASRSSEPPGAGHRTPAMSNEGPSTLTPATERAVVQYLKQEYLRNPGQRPARVCPAIKQIMERFGLTKSQCYELAGRLESLGVVEWVAKEAEGEFLRIQPTIMQAAQTADIQRGVLADCGRGKRQTGCQTQEGQQPHAASDPADARNAPMSIRVARHGLVLHAGIIALSWTGIKNSSAGSLFFERTSGAPGG